MKRLGHLAARSIGAALGRAPTRSLAIGLVLATATPIAAQTSSQGPSPGSIARLIDPVVSGRRGTVGVAVYAVAGNEALYTKNADTPLLPASNMKLYTTAAALDRLGPNFQFTTSLYAEGPLRPDGTLDGDLVIVGRGDPALSGRFYGDSATYVFDRLAEALRRQGVRRIRGSIVGDASYFDDARIAPGWESGNLLWWYGARASALSFNDNVVTIEVHPGYRVGQPPVVTFYPHTDRLEVVNSAATVGQRGGRSIGVRRRSDIGGYEIWGRIPVNSRPLRFVVAVEEPALFTVSVLRDRLQRAGITVTGADRVLHGWHPRSPQPRRLLASHTSPRMVEIVQVINKQSQNFFAEQVLKTLGAVFEGRGSFDAGGDVVVSVLNSLGVRAPRIQVVDGSGLSRYNQVTARATAQLLVGMRSHRWFDEFYNSLLIAGEDGDPRRLDSSAARGNVRTKTGTLRGVSALSGYVTTMDGELLAFSVISNGLRGKGEAIAIEDAIAERLARYSSYTSPLLAPSTVGK